MMVIYGKAKHIDKITLKKLPLIHKRVLLREIKYKGLSGAYLPDVDKITLGNPPDGLYSLYPEKAFSIVVSHEIMHRWLEKNIGNKASKQFDNIANKLKEYGVYWNYDDIFKYYKHDMYVKYVLQI